MGVIYLKYFLLFFIISIIFIYFFVLNGVEKESVRMYLFTSPKNYNHYRLSDMVSTIHSNNIFMGKEYHKKYYPNTIVTEYWKRAKNIKDYDILYDIAKNYQLKENDIDYDNTLIIHLRTGDVIEGTKYSGKDFFERKINWHHTKNYVRPKKYYEDILNRNIKKLPKKIIFFSGGSNSNSKYKKSLEYINLIKDFFRSKNFEILEYEKKQSSPDIDFVKMSRSKYFIKSGGGFSDLIKLMIEKNNGYVFE